MKICAKTNGKKRALHPKLDKYQKNEKKAGTKKIHDAESGTSWRITKSVTDAPNTTQYSLMKNRPEKAPTKTASGWTLKNDWTMDGKVTKLWTAGKTLLLISHNEPSVTKSSVRGRVLKVKWKNRGLDFPVRDGMTVLLLDDDESGRRKETRRVPLFKPVKIDIYATAEREKKVVYKNNVV